MTVQTQIEAKLKQLRLKCNSFPALQSLEDATNIPKEYAVLAGGALLLTLVFFGMGAGSLCNLVGFVYPSYKSFQAIENKVRGEDTQWLIYWIVYAFFSIIEVFVDFLLYWIPFYYAFKLAFLIWAMVPQTRGAKFLYDSFLRDFLKKNESKIDAALNDAKRSAATVASEVAGAAAEISSAGLSAAADYARTANGETKKDD